VVVIVGEPVVEGEIWGAKISGLVEVEVDGPDLIGVVCARRDARNPCLFQDAGSRSRLELSGKMLHEFALSSIR